MRTASSKDRQLRGIRAFVLFGCVMGLMAAGGSMASAECRKCIWVSRFEFKNADDIRRICENADRSGFTDLLFQVRGAGTVFFDSPYEPWAYELNGGELARLGENPGWDPLATAIKEGHKRGLRVHAWVNVMPAWALDRPPPASSGQLYSRHKSWLMARENGSAMSPNGFYAFLEPGLPEVRTYLRALFTQLAKDYAVDGLHLDYIRYPMTDETKVDVSHHPTVRKDFRARFGKSPEEATEQWLNYRASNISTTIREIKEGITLARPGIELTATCVASAEKRREGTCQDVNLWIDQGWVNAVVPMAYVQNDMKRFYDLCEPFATPQRRNRTWVGIWPRTGNSEYADQIKKAGEMKMGGVAVFSYSELFPGHRAGSKGAKVERTLAAISDKVVASVPASPAPATTVKKSVKTSSKSATAKKSKSSSKKKTTTTAAQKK